MCDHIALGMIDESAFINLWLFKNIWVIAS